MLNPEPKKKKNEKKKNKQKPDRHTVPSALTLTLRLATKHGKWSQLRSGPGAAFAVKLLLSGSPWPRHRVCTQCHTVLQGSGTQGVCHREVRCRGRWNCSFFKDVPERASVEDWNPRKGVQQSRGFWTQPTWTDSWLSAVGMCCTRAQPEITLFRWRCRVAPGAWVAAPSRRRADRHSCVFECCNWHSKTSKKPGNQMKNKSAPFWKCKVTPAYCYCECTACPRGTVSYKARTRPQIWVLVTCLYWAL